MQMDMFPVATQEEIKQTKSLLIKYRRMKAVVQELERAGSEHLALKERKVYNAYQKQLYDIDRAVRLILDPEIRKIIEMRYIKGERHKVIVIYFSSMHAATVDRKINEGIESVANTLIMLTD